MNKPFVRIAAVSVLAAAAGLAAAQDKLGDYRLGPGDSIKVQVYQSPDLSLEARVSESGVINYPLVGRINIGGLTVPDAEARIAQALKKNRILKAPQVNINVVQVRGSQVARENRLQAICAQTISCHLVRQIGCRVGECARGP